MATQTKPVAFATGFVIEVGEEGFEPPKALPADLQSAPVDHLGIRPWLQGDNFILLHPLNQPQQ